MDEEITNSVGNIKKKKNPTLPALKKAIGPAGTLALIREWGGTRVFIPNTMTIRHRLARLLGYDVATQLAAQLGGSTLAIPGKITGQREKRNIEIISLYDKGISAKELTRRFNLTDRSIYNIINSPSEKDDGDG
jgi:hypothetical protein